jgi:hypothetical protein
LQEHYSLHGLWHVWSGGLVGPLHKFIDDKMKKMKEENPQNVEYYNNMVGVEESDEEGKEETIIKESNEEIKEEPLVEASNEEGKEETVFEEETIIKESNEEGKEETVVEEETVEGKEETVVEESNEEIIEYIINIQNSKSKKNKKDFFHDIEKFRFKSEALYYLCSLKTKKGTYLNKKDINHLLELIR